MAQSEAANTSGKAEANASTKSSERKRFDRSDYFSLVALLVSVVSLLVAYRSSARSSDIAEQNLHVSQRAYVTLERMDWVSLTVGEGGAVRVRLRNSGSTPALNLKSRSTIRFRGAALPFDETALRHADTTGLIPSQIVLQPSGILELRPSSTDPENAVSIRRINEGTLKVYVFGEVTYDDVFDQSHTTKFCGYYQPPPANTFLGCDRYNQLD